jgi:hypothetical protein
MQPGTQHGTFKFTMTANGRSFTECVGIRQPPGGLWELVWLGRLVHRRRLPQERHHARDSGRWAARLLRQRPVRTVLPVARRQRGPGTTIPSLFGSHLRLGLARARTSSADGPKPQLVVRWTH